MKTVIVVVRLSPEVATHLDACAEANCRSRSGEIRFRLEQSVDGETINEHGVIVKSSTRFNAKRDSKAGSHA